MIRISPMFSDGMVLQRGKNISVFGTADDGCRVTVTLGGDTAVATARDGRWTAVLPARKAENGLDMTVTADGFSRTFTDIAVGEVWLAGGQSNMEYELQNCTTGKEHLENDTGVNVRFYYTQKINSLEPDYEEKITNNGWQKFDSETAKCWSAVGYIFAKKLSEKLGCTVGVIGCNWGGTKACHWMSAESLEKDTDMRFDYDKYLAAIEGKSDEELTKEYREYEEYHNAWNLRSADYYNNTPDATWDGCIKACGECRYPGPPVPLNPFCPTALYRSMIKVVCPYTISGFLYYQGESDDDNPQNYYKLLRGLIDLWRTDWGDPSLPFLIVQLPMHLYKGDTDRKNWCLIREAQDKVYRTVKNTGLAVAIDCGEFNEIHPHDKEVVAQRLYEQALPLVYGGEPNPPLLYTSAIRKNNAIEITTNTRGTLEVRGEKSGFEIAGADGVFKPADFEITGSRISVFSPDVPEPEYVRYLWTNYTDIIPIYAKDSGVPLAPFRA
ncbi:MAG: sialate O-acetylesterase [Ruminiclostridium sp.]|nr:sialate O-acetylesterase [Ruminiclostridium sp.]